jgi:hypothetical protein
VRTKKATYLILTLVCTFCGAIGVLIAWHYSSRNAALRSVALKHQTDVELIGDQSSSIIPEAAPNPVEQKAPPGLEASHSSTADTGASERTPTGIKPQKSPTKPAKSPRPPEKPIKDSLARAALALVGSDPEAEEYWLGAINDPNLSAYERQDLIEDLNEEGLSDPNNLAAEDLPLILRRIELIEELGPFAMDTVNDDAFQEAYKDLLKMAGKLLGR